MKKLFKILIVIFYLLLQLYAIPYTLYPTYAQVDIGKNFGFGNIGSLGEGTTRIVGPLFSIAAFLVILYFLLGAFKFIRAGGNKEEAEGGRQMINHAIIGFIILMFAFFILQFLLSRLFETNFRIIG